MHVLFVHQNFPAQFRHIVPGLAERGWEVTFVTNNTDTPAPPSVRKILYKSLGGAGRESDPCTASFQNEVAHARGVYCALGKLPEIRPDLIVAHSGFGSSLFLPHLYDAPIINFFEYYFRAVGQGLGYRPDAPVTETMLMRVRTRNAVFLLDLDNCNRGWCPNFWQRDALPSEYHSKIEVIPEGIDTDVWRPAARHLGERRLPDGTIVPAGTRIVTYVARGLERTRGFDIFMRAAKLVYQAFPNVLFVVVGGDRVHYGNDLSLIREKSFREHVLNSDTYDLSRFRFTGRVSTTDLAAILGQSDLHVYLTEPFVTSWSLLNAMSCGCVVLASDQGCVREYITQGENGLLCDFFDVEGLADKALAILQDPGGYRSLGEAARRTIEQRYALADTLPRIEQFFLEVAKRPRTPSTLAKNLLRNIRPGKVPLGPAGVPAGDVVRVDQPSCAPKSYPPFDGSIPWRPAEAARGSSRQVLRGRRLSRSGTVLFCWELGAGLGHLMQMLPLARGLVEQGHRVFMALNDVAGGETVLAGCGVCYLAAPNAGSTASSPRRYRITRSFAHVLANCGWCSEPVLFAVAAAWRNLFRLVRPDLILFDHSPTALLASRGLPARRALIGSGFCCPPDMCPWPQFASERFADLPPDRSRLLQDEQRLVDTANRVAARMKWPRLERMADLYGEVNENFLTTFPELDHYPQREGVAYWGPMFGTAGGRAPDWPASKGSGMRIFAYLKRFPLLPQVLQTLAREGRSVLAFVDTLDSGLRERLNMPNLRLVNQPVNLDKVGRECDLAVLNAGHGTTAQMLLSGCRVLLFPLHLEQSLTARAVSAMGAGATLSASEPTEISEQLEQLLTPGRIARYASAARQFEERYRKFDARRQKAAMLRRADELLDLAALFSAEPVRAERELVGA
jgi:glycosyltransferase involved in cell wall biosynthesis/UDP:flavonoid glycosyltransferase YjiC (YdhE family)